MWRIWKRWMLAAVSIWMLAAGGNVAHAAATLTDSIVLVMGIDEQGQLMESSNGIMIAGEEQLLIIAKSSDTWKSSAAVGIYGTQVDGTVNFLGDDADAGVSIFSAEIPDVQGYPREKAVSFQQLRAGQTVCYAGFVPNGTEGSSLEDMIVMQKSEVAASGELDGFTYVQMKEDFDDIYAGSPAFTEDGSLVGVLVKKENQKGLFLPMDFLIDIAGNEKSDSSGGSGETSGGGTESTQVDMGSGIASGSSFFYVLIPVIGVVFIAALISYQNEEIKRKGRGEIEFANVLGFGEDEAIKLRGIGGYFDGKEIPLNGRVTFGRDPDRCSAVYPGSTRGISSLHCQVALEGGKIILTDLGSTYGTFLKDGRKLTANESQVLNCGDSFYLADSMNLFMVL